MTTEDEISKELLVEEYKSCRELIGRNIEIIERTETYAIGGVGAIFLYAISSTNHFAAIGAGWSPLLIALLGRKRFMGIDDVIDKINNYLVELEKKYPTIGWTTSYRNHNHGKVLKKSRYSIWNYLLIFSILGGILVTWQNGRLAWAQMKPGNVSTVHDEATK